MIKLENITKSFNSGIVLDRVSLEITGGEKISVCGESGSGKTTLLRIIAGFEKADSGNITGCNRNDIAFVFQEPRLFEWCNTLENVTCASVKPFREAKEQAYEILEEFGLSDSINKKASELSGGMKQRTALARAFISGKSVIILDEPFASLDFETRINIRTKVKNFCVNKTLILVSHNDDDNDFLTHRKLQLFRKY